MTFWEKHDVEGKVLSILRDVSEEREGLHFGHPFLTVYQIAIEFAQRHPDTIAKQDWPVGGAGAGLRTS